MQKRRGEFSILTSKKRVKTRETDRQTDRQTDTDRQSNALCPVLKMTAAESIPNTELSGTTDVRLAEVPTLSLERQVKKMPTLTMSITSDWIPLQTYQKQALIAWNQP